MKVRLIIAVLTVIALGSFASILAEGSMVNTRYRASLCRDWKFKEENSRDCNGVVVSFPTVVLITSIMSFATLASLLWLALHMVAADLTRGGSDLSTMLVIYLVIKVIFLGLHATFIAMTWHSKVPTRHEFGLIILAIDVVMVLLASCTWAKVVRMQEQMLETVRTHRAEVRSACMEKLPTATFQELQSSSRLPENCIICLSDFEPNCKVTRLACGHIFHAACIKNWLVDAAHDTCPYRCHEDPLDLVEASEEPDSNRVEP
ncbi:RNF148 [Symbiodinium pilosum]|uniref:RNF148 protein n=1 Tax=Symbiodinium pilosum TaxID=2952 RepID=A0A812VFF0_SYMPI|nr:RNF148 [Symbiodinium pilosum]